MRPEDIFVLRLSDRHKHLRHPVHKPLKQSACTPLFYKAYDLRNAGACVHTHSIHAVMATLLWKGEVWTISHQEMIKVGALPFVYFRRGVRRQVPRLKDYHDVTSEGHEGGRDW